MERADRRRMMTTIIERQNLVPNWRFSRMVRPFGFLEDVSLEVVEHFQSSNVSI